LRFLASVTSCGQNDGDCGISSQRRCR